MEELVLDVEFLFNIADIVDDYCVKQREVVDVYYAQIMALESEWRDDETFGTMVQELNALKTQAIAILDEVYDTYPQYFRKRAQQILERPIYRNESTIVYGSKGTEASEYSKGYDAITTNEANIKTSVISELTINVTSNPSQKQEQLSGLLGEVESKGDLFTKIFSKKISIQKILKCVEHRSIRPAMTERSEEQIINDISGGDLTEGSCSSLAFAYAGNKAGYVVFDFRDGQSRRVFSLRDTIKQIATMQGVDSFVEYGKNDGECAERLLIHMEPGKEYYMATGRHAAIVRIPINGGYQYLELQSGIQDDNGWQPLTQRALYERFCCKDGHSTDWSSYLISLDSLQKNTEFLNLLGYINTDKPAQVKGTRGHVK